MNLGDLIFYAVLLFQFSAYLGLIFSARIPGVRAAAYPLNIFSIWLCAVALSCTQLSAQTVALLLAQLALQNYLLAGKTKPGDLHENT